jgi:murein DD-endopeptidase MepM/ murein hydrolase activator NlpD
MPMTIRPSRRSVIRAAVAVALSTRVLPTSAQIDAPAFSLPIGLQGRVLGDGFLVRHGYACENTWYNPGWWHTGEDWYLPEGNTAGAGVFAAAAGDVVFTDSDYPGRVVIVRHATDLFSMYGHLDSALAVRSGDAVLRGQRLGTVLDRTDGRAPSHLHFELRTFLTTPEVNGNAPRYRYGCGEECPPGPGYWPIDAPEHPSDMGWRNPTHVIAHRMFGGRPPAGFEVIVAEGASNSTGLWSLPSGRRGAQRIGGLPLTAGNRFPLVSIANGAEASRATSAEGYRLWYQIALPAGDTAWVQAAVPSTHDTGSDGRPSSVRVDFLPVVQTGS